MAKNGAVTGNGRELGTGATIAIEEGETTEEEVRGEGVDICRIGDLDMEYYEKQVIKRIDAFYAEVEKIRAGKAELDLFGIAWPLVDLGLVEDKKKKEDPTVIKPFTKEDLLRDYRWHWEFGTRAVVDTTGEWYEKGEMGMFGCSSESPGEAANWDANFFARFLKDEDPNTLLVTVDCHI